MRLGEIETTRAVGVAIACNDNGLATMPLEPGAFGVPVDTPWFLWASGRVACVVASALDADEPYWDLVLLRRATAGDRWSVIYRASAYAPPDRSLATETETGQITPRLSLARLAVNADGHPHQAPRLVNDRGGTARGELAGKPIRPRVDDDAPSSRASSPTDYTPTIFGDDEAQSSTRGAYGTPFQSPVQRVVRALDTLETAIQESPLGGPRLPWSLFWCGIAVYLATRLWGVTDYPIAFDGDEAAIVVLGRALLESGFRDAYGIWFPIFFAYPNWNPDIGVYVHLLTSALFGVSVTVARATAALLSTPAPFALAAALRWGFAVRGWWLAPYVLSALPIWFHLSRSAYDSATWVAFFACAVAAYYRYRFYDPQCALYFVVASLLTFYSNAVAHVFALLLALVILVIDWRYHLANWRAWRVPVAVGLLGMVPLATFLGKNPGYVSQRLSSTHPHWGDGTRPLTDTFLAQARAAATSLNPMVWFVSDNRGLYVDVTGYHNYYPGTMPLLPWWVGVMVAVGLIAIWHPTFKGRRAILLSLLGISVAPSVIARFAPTRCLAVVVPIVLLSLFWADLILPRGRRFAFVAGACAVVFTTTSAFATLSQAITTQSTRVQDFGGYGIQWGSKEVFALVNQRLRATPGARVMVTTDWTWGGHHFMRFFVDRHDLVSGRVFLGSLETILKSRVPWGPELWSILSPSQLEFLRERMRIGVTEGTGARVVEATVTDLIAHPDGSAGFVMVRLREASNIHDILEAERAAASRPTYTDMVIDGQITRVGTTSIEDGFVGPVLNRAPNALVRFVGPNPTIVDVAYPSARSVSAIRLVLGAGMWKVNARLSEPVAEAVLNVTGTGERDGPNSVVNLTVDGPPFQARRIVYEIFQPNATEDDSTVHLYSVEVRP
jgi:hypothetical protein